MSAKIPGCFKKASGNKGAVSVQPGTSEHGNDLHITIRQNLVFLRRFRLDV
jgi:hypothetical protein